MPSNILSILDEFSPTKDLRIGVYVSSAELHDHMEEIKEVEKTSYVGNENGSTGVCGHAGRAADVGEVEVKRVDKERDEGREEENVVPPVDNVAVWVEDLVPP